jgi:hypothetical protein
VDLFGVPGSGIMLADEQNVLRYVAASDGPETLGMGEVHPWDRIESRGQHFNETRRLGRRARRPLGGAWSGVRCGRAWRGLS